MRRSIFALLILANIGLFIWGIYYLGATQTDEPEPDPTVAPEKMRKLDKKDLSRARAQPPRNTDTENKPSLVPAKMENAPAAPTTICYRLGPLSDVEQTQQIELGIAGLAFVRRDESTPKVTGYRVYLPSFPTKEDAERKRRDLTRLGFKDHALLQEEGLQNALSLGVFSQEKNAQARVKRLAEKGIEAKIQPVEQGHHVYWIDIGPANAAPDLQTRISAAVAGISGAESKEIPCPAAGNGIREITPAVTDKP